MIRISLSLSLFLLVPLLFHLQFNTFLGLRPPVFPCVSRPPKPPCGTIYKHLDGTTKHQFELEIMSEQL